MHIGIAQPGNYVNFINAFFMISITFLLQANTTGDVINRIPYSTLDIVVRENVRYFVITAINYATNTEINFFANIDLAISITNKFNTA